MEAKKLIRLTSPADVQDFVSMASSYPFDIDLKYNRIIVDAKSFLGVLSLISNPVMVFCHGEDSSFDQALDRFAAC